MTRTALILGDGGFIGANLDQQMRSRDWTIIGHVWRLYREREDCCGTTDIRDTDSLQTLLEPFDGSDTVVINCAAIKGSIACAANPREAISTNTIAVRELGMLCAELELPLIHLGTTSYYRTTSKTITEQSEIEPQTLYGLTKYAAELELELTRLAHEVELEYIVIRPVFGYGNSGQFRSGMQEAWPDIILREIRRGRTTALDLNLGGQYRKDWTHITDLVDGIERLARLFVEDRGAVALGEPILLGAGKNYPLTEVVAALNPGFEVRYHPEQDYKQSQVHEYDVLRSLLPGWSARVDVVEWGRSRGGELNGS